MKYIIIPLLMVSFARNINPVENKCYYYRWSFWVDGANGWGENHICSNHVPSKKEVLIDVKKLVGNDKYFKYYSVDIIEPSESKSFCNCQPIVPIRGVDTSTIIMIIKPKKAF